MICIPTWSGLAIGIFSMLGVVMIFLTLFDVITGRLVRRAGRLLDVAHHGEEQSGRKP
jgi:hypothetical protein